MSVAFQAADLIAYEHYKANLKVQKANLKIQDAALDMARLDELRLPFRSLASVPGSNEWGVVMECNLIETCERYRVPLR